MINGDYSSEHDVLLRLQTSKTNGGIPIQDEVWKRYDVKDDDLKELVDAVSNAVREYQRKKVAPAEAWRIESHVTIDNVIISRNGTSATNGVEKKIQEETTP